MVRSDLYRRLDEELPQHLQAIAKKLKIELSKDFTDEECGLILNFIKEKQQEFVNEKYKHDQELEKLEIQKESEKAEILEKMNALQNILKKSIPTNDLLQYFKSDGFSSDWLADLKGSELEQNEKKRLILIVSLAIHDFVTAINNFDLSDNKELEKIKILDKLTSQFLYSIEDLSGSIRIPIIKNVVDKVNQYTDDYLFLSAEEDPYYLDKKHEDVGTNAGERIKKAYSLLILIKSNQSVYRKAKVSC